jgi:hypothetical protein
MPLSQSLVAVTVVETAAFLQSADAVLDDLERELLVDYLAYNPTAGDLISGGGGLRKLRWRMEGRGKRGGARVIYYFHDLTIPLFALAAYAKNQKSDLGPVERNDLKRFIAKMISDYQQRKKP